MSLLHRKIVATALMFAILIGGWSARPALGRPAAPAPPQKEIISPPSETETIAVAAPLRGLVTLEGRSNHAGITILADGQPAATTDAHGNFEIIGLTPGPHLVAARMPGYLAAATGEIELHAIPETSLVIRAVRLLAGDANNDGRVNVFDLGMVSSGSPAADLNGDGQTNLLDMVLVSSNYGHSAPIAWTGISLRASAAPVEQEPPPGDVDGDGVVGNSDLVIVATAYGSQPPSDSRADLNQDGEVNLTDLLLVADHFGQTGAESTQKTEQVQQAQQATPTPTPTTTPELPSCRVTSYGLNVRSGPGTVYPVLTAVSQDTSLEIIARESHGWWIQVRTPDGIEGWVAAAYVQCNVPVSEIGVAENIPPPVFTPTPVHRAARRALPPAPRAQPKLPAFPIPSANATPEAPAIPFCEPPVLISPQNGETFEESVTLRWSWNGVLGPDMHFDVQVWRPGERPRGVAWSDTTSWSGPLLGPRGARLWRIVVISGRNGQWLADLCPPSGELFFNYRPKRGGNGGGSQAPLEPPPPSSTSQPPGPSATPGPPTEPISTSGPPTATETQPAPPPPTDTPVPYPADTAEPTAYPPPAARLGTGRLTAARSTRDVFGGFPLLLLVPAASLMAAAGPIRRRR